VKTEAKSSDRPIGQGLKRAMLATFGLLTAVISVIALANREFIWFGIFAVATALVFLIVAWGTSAAIDWAAYIVEHIPLTWHVPGRSPRHRPTSKDRPAEKDRTGEG